MADDLGTEQERARAAVDALREAADRADRAGMAELVDETLSSLTAVLRTLDRYQQDDSLYGAWYYTRDVLEDVLGLERGTLDNPRLEDTP